MPDKFIPGTHILWSEYKCKCCGRLPVGFYSNPDEISIEYMMLFKGFEFIRARLGNEPLSVTRGYTCEEHQIEIYLELILKKYKELTRNNISKIAWDKTMTALSIHLFGLALDILPKKEKRVEAIKAAKQFSPKFRIGHKAYEDNDNPHIHTDLGHLITPKFSKKLREGAEW